MEVWYPGATRLPITTLEYWKPRGAPLEDIVDHITDGEDSRSYLQNANNGSSVHFLIRIEGNKAVVYQFMPTDWAAWGNGIYSNNNPYMPPNIKRLIDNGININRESVSIEHERKWPFTTTLPELMVIATIDLHKWLCDNNPTIKRDRDHIIGHYQVNHIDKANCPGGPGGKLFPFDRIIAALNPAPPPPPPVYFSETGQSVAYDFYAFWQAHGGLEIFGYPVKPEAVITINGVTVPAQSFERARLERHPDGIKLGLVEVERLRALGLL